VDESDETLFKNIMAKCGSTSALNYDLDFCWQRFNVTFNVAFKSDNETRSTAASKLKSFYAGLFRQPVVIVRDNGLLLFKLTKENTTSPGESIYLDAKRLDDVCKKYLLVNRLALMPRDENECLSTVNQTQLFDFALDDLINEESDSDKDLVISSRFENPIFKCTYYFSIQIHF
jgi:hypothetical protein